MPYVHLVIALALVEFLIFGTAVARARTRYHVAPPATTGNAEFERYFRAHMNTLEQLVIFLPAIVLFAHYLNAYIAASFGVLFIIGRALYFQGYVRAPQARHIGFILTVAPNLALLTGAIIGAIVALSARS
jgi:glutathione S-transferase